MKLLTALLVTLLAVAVAEAEVSEYVSDMASELNNVVSTNTPSGGTYVFTNQLTYAWRLGSCMFRLPASTTNTFTLDHVKVIETAHYKGNVVTTNVFGTVETNYYPTLLSNTYVYVTNNLVTDLTTNVESCVYSVNHLTASRRILDYVYILGGDQLVFTWTYTNSLWLQWSGLR